MKDDDNGQGGEHGKPKIEIFINDQPHEVDDKSMTGAELKSLAGVPAEYQLFVEKPGQADDELVNSNTTVKLHKGMRFYSQPPATFG